MLTKQIDTQSAPPQPAGTTWHTMEIAQVLDEMDVQAEHGLDDAVIQSRLQYYGANELVEKGLTSPLVILWEQITNPLVLLLILAAGISLILGKADSVIAIMAIVIINAVLGVVQEYRAEQAMAALKKMAAPLVRARRGGKVIDVESRNLVPGDIVLLEAGSIVPADSRVLESSNMQAQEASLTGESQPVEKSIKTLTDDNAPLGDRQNMLY